MMIPGDEYAFCGAGEKGALGSALDCLPPDIKRAVMFLQEGARGSVEEIRLRNGRECAVTFSGKESALTRGGRLYTPGGAEQGITVTPEHIAYVVEHAAQGSIYAAEETLREGYITVPGGHRVGVCGHAVTEDGRITTIKNFSSVCIRISRAAHGASARLAEGLVSEGKMENTLLLSPPLCGKTTLLRDIIRELSARGLRVGVADERGELAGMVRGEPQFDLGARTDIVDGCGKADGAMLLLRGMAPDVIAMDEITAEEDAAAIEQAANCGVSVICTAHAATVEEFYGRRAYSRLAESGVFKRIAVLYRRGEGFFGRLYTKEEKSGNP